MLLPQVFSLVILKLRYLRFNISRLSPGFSKATFCGSSQVPRDASAVAVAGFCCFSGPEASDMSKEIGTKMPFFFMSLRLAMILLRWPNCRIRSFSEL